MTEDRSNNACSCYHCIEDEEPSQLLKGVEDLCFLLFQKYVTRWQEPLEKALNFEG